MSGVPSSRSKLLYSRKVRAAAKTSGVMILLQQALELGIGQVDAVEGLELLAEVLFQRGAVADVGTVGVFEVFKFRNQLSLDVTLCRH